MALSIDCSGTMGGGRARGHCRLMWLMAILDFLATDLFRSFWKQIQWAMGGGLVTLLGYGGRAPPMVIEGASSCHGGGVFSLTYDTQPCKVVRSE